MVYRFDDVSEINSGGLKVKRKWCMMSYCGVVYRFDDANELNSTGQKVKVKVVHDELMRCGL